MSVQESMMESGLYVCMYVCMYVHTYVCLYECMYVHICMYVSVCVCMQHRYEWLCIHTHLHTYNNYYNISTCIYKNIWKYVVYTYV